MEIINLESVDSTNKYAKEHINEISDKTVISADVQTSGRGRFDRKWNYQGMGNIYASIILKPSNKFETVYSSLTQYLCVILSKTFEEYGVQPKIKWPNDILINNKKISGILAEAVIEKNELKGIVLGVGINLNSTKEELEKINQPATSLNNEIGMTIDKENFINSLLKRFYLKYNDFIQNGFALIKEDYEKRANFLGKEITIKVFDKEINGIAKEITIDGALKIVDKNNKEQTLYMGDIL
ncbi:MAG: biotin--[acetyl-CoA-carboxylase] ligase [bacterium]|nr:biotin--[acetyl-CoA-carboxylase] ligase [bacterium]